VVMATVVLLGYFLSMIFVDGCI